MIAETIAAPAPAPVGDSSAQRAAEHVMIDLLGTELSLALRPRRSALADEARIEVDGVDDDTTILVEAWAHHGTPKSAQKHKVLADVLKLLHLATTLPTTPRLGLCLCDSTAAHHFTAARSWAAHALRDFGIEVHIVDLPPALKADVIAAQQRQYR